MHKPKKKSQNRKPIVDYKEILYVVTGRLDEILERCKALEHYKRNITNLAKFTKKAAENNQGTVI